MEQTFKYECTRRNGSAAIGLLQYPGLGVRWAIPLCVHKRPVAKMTTHCWSRSKRANSFLALMMLPSSYKVVNTSRFHTMPCSAKDCDRCAYDGKETQKQLTDLQYGKFAGP